MSANQNNLHILSHLVYHARIFAGFFLLLSNHFCSHYRLVTKMNKNEQSCTHLKKIVFLLWSEDEIQIRSNRSIIILCKFNSSIHHNGTIPLRYDSSMATFRSLWLLNLYFCHTNQIKSNQSNWESKARKQWCDSNRSRNEFKSGEFEHYTQR